MHVILSGEPAIPAYTVRREYGANGPIYQGWAKSRQEIPPTLTILSVSKAAAASFTCTAHGMETGNLVLIQGATGDWAQINGTRAIISTGADAFTVAVNSTAFAGSFDGTVQCLAPRTKDPVWSIQKSDYTGVNPTLETHPNGDSSPNAVWDNRASLSYQ